MVENTNGDSSEKINDASGDLGALASFEEVGARTPILPVVHSECQMQC